MFDRQSISHVLMKDFPSRFSFSNQCGFLFFLFIFVTTLEESSLVYTFIPFKAVFIRINTDLSCTPVLSVASATFGNFVLIWEDEGESWLITPFFGSNRLYSKIVSSFSFEEFEDSKICFRLEGENILTVFSLITCCWAFLLLFAAFSYRFDIFSNTLIGLISKFLITILRDILWSVKKAHSTIDILNLHLYI